ncbi:aminotransferase, LLPSF_NHT_00031 family [Alteromonadaceae bacterium Bs31]|nr:aminotransferase, LLPSF_NHT_00031 family [Alteromonadaceae bacterium Bs31]
MSSKLIEFIRDMYSTTEFIPLHAPSFSGNERKYVVDAIESTYVSSVGKYVNEFERRIEAYTGAERAVATVNGTAALHTALYLAGVTRNDLVITQALTFVATCNAIAQLGAKPVFVDVSKVSLGLCPTALQEFLTEYASVDKEGACRLVATNERIRAVVPMHTFGHPVQIDELLDVCKRWSIELVEDAAESLGSFYKGRHTGTHGRFSALSFNGNKIITTGGGGMVLCRKDADGKRAKHITTTAKVPHEFEYFHDEQGFNYRLPNINSALGCAQMESLERYVEKKRVLAAKYEAFFSGTDFHFFVEPDYAKSNYWLNAVLTPDKDARDNLLKETNGQGVMTRPVWTLMHRLPMFCSSVRGDLSISEWAEAHIVNIPSSPVWEGLL